MSIARHHNDWLLLVPNSGPFLSLPVLAQAFPQGLDAHDPDHARRLRMAFEEWDDNQLGKRPDPVLHRAWIKFVLGETLSYEELLAEGQAIPQTLKSEVAEYHETLRPDWVVNDPVTKVARLLVQGYPRSQSLTKPVALSRWKTSPDTRMMQLLHDTGIRLGLVTNGDHWMLVNAPKNETTGYVSWYANLWLEEKDTLRAFRTLLCAERFFGVPDTETLDLKDGLLDKSAADQQEVTDQLGYQVRKAVEVLIQSLDKADQDHGGKLLTGVEEKILYESALTVMMRLVFLFCAEERELLLLGDDLYDKNYAVSTLREQLEVAKSEHTEEILGLRYDAWPRLLTTFRAVYAGVNHDRLKLPAYGGSLFNPDRFPFLEGRPLGTSWRDTEATPLPVNNRTVLHLLDSLQSLASKIPGQKEVTRRKLSFRSLDIEQIGHVYEGLLDHTAKRATEPVLGLQGTRDKEPEIPLAELEKLLATEDTESTERITKPRPASLSVTSVNSVAHFLTKLTGRSESAIKKGLNAEIDDQLASRFGTACQDSMLWKRVKPFAGLVRQDTTGYPVVITTGSVFVTSGTDRRSSGTHYTPKSLTEPIVQYTLEPLVYIGPAEGLPKEQWKLRSAKELLALKICDMACGSGAFLVQACRYMATRLQEAWEEGLATEITEHTEKEQQEPKKRFLDWKTCLFSSVPSVSSVALSSDEEQEIYALRIVAQRCLYGVDINPLAVEMAKLSLWLLTLAKDKPFEFLDHSIRCGDSLVGIHNTEQLRKFNLDGKGEDNRLFLQFMDEKIKEAIALRRQITEMQANTVEDVEAQDRMLREANEKIDRLKCAADMLISAEFVPGSTADKRAARDGAAIKVAVHFNDSELPTFRREVQKALGGQVTFHWPLEFPEVMVERSGFDAFVGNPPFMGGTQISEHNGQTYKRFLSECWPHLQSRADLCVIFSLRAWQLVRESGGIGLIGSNSTSETDSRLSGPAFLISNGTTIYRAVKSMTWPGDAAVYICHVYYYKGAWAGAVYLDDDQVNSIDSAFAAKKESLEPRPLNSNRESAYTGTKVYGNGFVIHPEIATKLFENSSIYRQVVKPYLIGRETNEDPECRPARFIIDFTGLSKEQAQSFPMAWEIIDRHVREERQSAPEKRMRDVWWQFQRPRAELYRKLAENGVAWVASIHSDTLAFAGIPVAVDHPIVISHAVIVLALREHGEFAVVQGAVHAAWARQYGSSIKGDLRYTLSDCFETFPFPANSDALNQVGFSYFEHRRLLMMSRQEGLTESYKRFNAPKETSADIQKLRQLHVEMDNAVAAAYGWTDLDLGHGFHETKQGVRYTISEPARREVLARLLKLNHERYAEEVRQGLHEKKKGRGKKKAEPDESGGLFE